MHQLNEIQRAWVAALRSGEHAQTKGTLTKIISAVVDDSIVRSEAHCCLGLACKVMLENGQSFDRSVTFAGTVQYDGREGLLSYDNQVRLGMRTDDGHLSTISEMNLAALDAIEDEMVRDGLRYGNAPEYERYEGKVNLASLNDDGFTFDQIADLIERFADDLFEAE